MPRYVATVHSPLSVADAFTFMADMRLYPSWDPSIVRAVQVVGHGPGPDAQCDLTVGLWFGLATLRYRVTSFEPPRSMVIEARNRWVSSYDVVTVEPSSTGSRVTYDAELTLHGPDVAGRALLGVPFRLLCDRATAGLRQVLTAPGTDQP